MYCILYNTQGLSGGGKHGHTRGAKVVEGAASLVIDGRYQLGPLISRGLFSQVYRATDQQKPVVVMLRPSRCCPN